MHLIRFLNADNLELLAVLRDPKNQPTTMGVSKRRHGFKGGFRHFRSSFLELDIIPFTRFEESLQFRLIHRHLPVVFKQFVTPNTPSTCQSSHTWASPPAACPRRAAGRRGCRSGPDALLANPPPRSSPPVAKPSSARAAPSPRVAAPTRTWP